MGPLKGHKTVKNGQQMLHNRGQKYLQIVLQRGAVPTMSSSDDWKHMAAVNVPLPHT